MATSPQRMGTLDLFKFLLTKELDIMVGIVRPEVERDEIDGLENRFVVKSLHGV